MIIPNYRIVVEDNKEIGDRVKFTITPVNEGLVFATVKSCDVTRGTDELTIIGHGADQPCTNPIVQAAAETPFFSSKGEIEGSWKAFKWSTKQENNLETQGLSCTIGLSKSASAYAVVPCTASNLIG